MQFRISVRNLNRSWALTSLCAIAAFAVLAVLDRKLKTATGYGTIDLQRASTADAVNLILADWNYQRRVILAGFNLGFDYLFMPLWGFALFFGALAARERFAPRPGFARRAMLLVCAIPLAGMLLDVAENAIELYWIMQGVTDKSALIGHAITNAKWLCLFTGLVVWLAALLGRFIPRKDQNRNETFTAPN